MQTYLVKSICLTLAVIVFGCKSPDQRRETLTAQTNSKVALLQVVASQTVRWPIPPGLPTFGASNVDSIRVAVFGMSGMVKRPGYYYLRRGAVVIDAINAADGLGDFVARHYSGIERPKLDGSFEVIIFTRNRSAEEQISLRDGDRIYFGQEVF